MGFAQTIQGFPVPLLATTLPPVGRSARSKGDLEAVAVVRHRTDLPSSNPSGHREGTMRPDWREGKTAEPGYRSCLWGGVGAQDERRATLTAGPGRPRPRRVTMGPTTVWRPAVAAAAVAAAAAAAPVRAAAAAPAAPAASSPPRKAVDCWAPAHSLDRDAHSWSRPGWSHLGSWDSRGRLSQRRRGRLPSATGRSAWSQSVWMSSCWSYRSERQLQR